MHWHEVLGNEITATDIVAMAQVEGVTVREMIETTVYELAADNPDGEWEDITRDDLDEMAIQIEQEAQDE